MDRLRDYFTDRLDDMLFVELSDEFIEKAGAENFRPHIDDAIARAAELAASK